jgi:hypothetical protein
MLAAGGYREMPLQRFEIHSPLSTQTVLQRLQSLVRDEPGFMQVWKEAFGGRPKNSPPFFGVVAGNEFLMRRDIRYRNSFLPRVHGTVLAEPGGGSKVRVTMHLHPLIAVVMALWLAITGLGTLIAVFSMQRGAEVSLVPSALLAFGVVLVAVGFYPEARKARRVLEQAIADASLPTAMPTRAG